MAKAVVTWGIVSLMLMPLLYGTLAQAEAIGGFVVPTSKAAQLDRCVEPTEAMRRYHMDLIRHQRDTTVYGGIRGTKHSMSGCVDCHAGHDASGEPIPVAAPGQFCQACHHYAAIKLNCFDCHATVPKGEAWNQEPEPTAPEANWMMNLLDLHLPRGRVTP